MPIIRVELLSGRNQEQKREFANRVTQLTAEVLKCGVESVDVIFNEVQPDDWMHGGKTYAMLAAEKTP